MANVEHIALLKQGGPPGISGATKTARSFQTSHRVSLSGAAGREVDLRWAKLSGAKLGGANLSGAKLTRSDLATHDRSRTDEAQ